MDELGTISIQNLFFSYKRIKEINVFENFSIDFKPKKIVALLGPSGCGKSTLINLIAGFYQADQGRILLNDKQILSSGIDRGIVFQDRNLFPWKTVQENVEFGLRMKGKTKLEIKKSVSDILTHIGLFEFKDVYPFELSGGMAQRVAFARTIINNPEVLLLDEPFGSLDSVTRLQMQNFFLSFWKQYKTTVVFITHDIDEALLVADRVILFSKSPVKIIKDVFIEFPRPSVETSFEDQYFRNIRRLLSNILYEEAKTIL